MNLTLRPGVDLTDARPFSLGGVEFKIGRLMLRENMRIAPRMPSMLTAINRRSDVLRAVPMKDGKPDFSGVDPSQFLILATFNEAETEDAIYVIHAAITRAHPYVTIDDLLDLPIAPNDLLPGVNLVLEQSKLTHSAVDDASSGEAPAASL